MIKYNDIDISLIYFGNIAISAVYYGANVVWQAVRSCFGKGYWIKEKPWKKDDSWKN